MRNLTYLTPTLKESFDASYEEVEFNTAYYMRIYPQLHQWFDPTEKVSSRAISYLFINTFFLPLLCFGITPSNNIYL